MTMLYYDCFAGISGDMNLGALLDLGVDESALRAALEGLGLDGYALRVSIDSRRGISGTRAQVRLDEGAGQPRRNLPAVKALLGASRLREPVARFALEVFERLARAESQVHGVALEQVHFHEVGAVDALIDIVGAAVCLDLLGWPRVIASSVELGSGTAECAHGLLPVPAPATMELLVGVPTRRGGVPFEATTPTGAAILTAAAERFDDRVSYTARKVGYGVGGRDGPLPNLLRVLLADRADGESARSLVELACNIDDMSPELYPHLIERALDARALDAWYTPTVMKKGRAGILVGVLCEPDDARQLTNLLFSETSTLGVRRHEVSRIALPRTQHSLETRFGPVGIKVSLLPDGTRRVKPEHDDCRAIALRHRLPLREVYADVERQLEVWDGE